MSKWRMANELVDLSVVVVNWNTRELLARCLRSVYDTAHDLGCEVLVVDNASTDGSAAMVRDRFPQVCLIENGKNVGFARASNQAIHESGGRYVMLLNSDTEALPGALQEMVRFMDAHLQAGGCGPLLLNVDGSLQPSCHPMLTPGRELWRLLFLDRLWRRATYDQARWDRRVPRQVEVIKGACFFLRRKALDEVGLLDERYFMYTEEMDLCYRLLRAGWELWWVPQARVVHCGEASSRQVAESMYVQLYRSKVQFYRKFGGACRVALFKWLVLLAYAPRMLVAALGAVLSHHWLLRARTYRRLLVELPAM
jgi:GT2 family glycosyltransferase